MQTRRLEFGGIGGQGGALPLSMGRIPSTARHPAGASVQSTRAPGLARTRIKANVQAKEQPQATFDVESKVAFLKEDLSHLFDDKGIDASSYEDVVDFRDPITKYSKLSGYLFNIAFLKKAFNPKFELHDIWPSDPTSVTTRWTMSMEFTATRSIPIIKDYFKPTIVFTGTSTYVFNPASDKIFRHIDIWDSISNQEFFSLEGFGDFLKQLFQPYTTPALETPDYTLLKRTKDYQVRKYTPFTVAECPMDSLAAGQAAGPAGPGTKAFGALAGYIFGRNDRGQVMKMTTPVYSDTKGSMRFVIGPSAAQAPPAPVSSEVSVKEEPGGLYAVRLFNGVAQPDSAAKEYESLASSLQRDGLQAAGGAEWTLARYNDPSTPATFRRNEVMVALDEESFVSRWRQ